MFSCSKGSSTTRWNITNTSFVDAFSDAVAQDAQHLLLNVDVTTGTAGDEGDAEPGDSTDTEGAHGQMTGLSSQL